MLKRTCWVGLLLLAAGLSGGCCRFWDRWCNYRYHCAPPCYNPCYSSPAGYPQGPAPASFPNNHCP